MKNFIEKEKSRAEQAYAPFFTARAQAVKSESEVTVGFTAESTKSGVTPTEPETVLSAELPDSAEPETTKSEATTSETTKSTRKKGRPTVNRETKKRYTITLMPSLYAKASDKAAEQGRSLSEVIGRYLEAYIKE
ncbi:MAG: hypothetical protein K0S01_3423 [Herbinix sp.]|jgi:hypothetical protein|nr:hypothetical protein [Herbinix sp.]